MAHKLALLLDMLARARGLECFQELDLHAPGSAGYHDYRNPDLIVAAPADLSARAVEGHAELVVEILSPSDESRLKFDFYALCRVPEVWLVDPNTRELEVYVLRGDGTAYDRVAADEHRVIRAPRFDLAFSVVAGPLLRIVTAGGDVTEL